jgi:hypothetical protein
MEEYFKVLSMSIIIMKEWYYHYYYYPIMEHTLLLFNVGFDSLLYIDS